MTVVCSIYDSKVEAYSQPFFARSLNEAIRLFTDHVNDPGSLVNKHPEDFSLYYVADWDDHNGMFSDCDHRNLGLATAFVRSARLDVPSLTPDLDRQNAEGEY